jgi:hypothetical protein
MHAARRPPIASQGVAQQVTSEMGASGAAAADDYTAEMCR